MPEFQTLDESGVAGSSTSAASSDVKPGSGAAHKPAKGGDGKSGIPGAVFNLANAIIGAGVGGMPYALKLAGFWGGLFLIAIVASCSDYTVRLIVTLSRKTHSKYYEDLVSSQFGHKGYLFVVGAMGIFAYGAMVAYLMGIGDNMAIVVATATGINIGKPENRWVKRATLVGIAIGAVLPLALLKNMAALAKTSFLSLAAVVVILGVVIKNAAMGPGDAPTFLTSKDPADAELRVVDSKFFPAVGVIAFAFVCHHACFIVFNTLRDNTEARWAKTVHSTLLVASGVMGTLAMCAFLTFRGVIKGSFLTNYSYKEPLCNFMRCLFAVTQTLTYPIELFVARHSIHAIAFPAQKWTDEQHYVITLLLWGSSVAIALNVADLGAVLELTGGVAAVSIGFLVPSILHFKMTPEVNYKCWQARGAAKKWAACKVFGRSWFVLCLGVLAMLFTLVSMVDHMTAGGGHGDGIDAFDPTIEYDQYGIPIVNANGVTSGHGSITADSSGTGQLSLT